MRISTRLIAAASFAAMSLVAGAALADGDTIVFGTDATYPPFESLDAGGKFTGFDIDITNALCDHMKVKCTFVNQDFDGIIPALQAKKFDAIISSMSITPEREKIVLTLYYYENLTLQEIGKVLGVTESRVCQIHTKAVLQLRHRLAGLEREPA